MEGERLSLEVFLAFEWTLGNSRGSFKPYDGSHQRVGFFAGVKIRVVKMQQIQQYICQ